ncbi:MAG: hypothetical protein AB8G05_10470 [Oligoflexales bacterium]
MIRIPEGNPLRWLICGFTISLFASVRIYAGIHTVPIIISAQTIRAVQYHPVGMYRVFKSSPDGRAIPIPFQIDEKDRYGDYILAKGPLPNQKLSNGIFDFKDELSVMGNDVGPVKIPTKWIVKKPSVLYEIKFINPKTKKVGAIYVGAYFSDPPPPSKLSYISFNLKNAEILTSRYRYAFNPNNYLIINDVFINHGNKQPYHLIDASTLFLRADLKYFLTLTINQENIDSELEAYKDGPIRCIARVNFNYKVLKLNFDLGMYTEVSFFSNSVILPALIDNPLDGKRILNEGSQFYYGFSFIDNPSTLDIETNMPEYQEKTILDFLKGKKKVKKHYWFTATSDDYMIYVELDPSVQMQRHGNVPMFYKENTSSRYLKTRPSSADSLGKSPVNFAISLDLTSFTEGLHNVAIKLFVENKKDEKLLREYKTIDDWEINAKRLPSAKFK